MTENEAIKEIKRWTEILLRAGSRCTTETAEAQDMAIKALEDMQQYRALGTVEKLTANMEELKRWHTDKIAPNVKNPFAYTSTLCCCNCDHKDEYIEELEAEVEDYQQIGTPEELRVLKDKQVAKKVSLRRVRKVDGFDMGKCPTCGEDVSRDCDGTDIFCPDCGQKLNWEDEG